MSNPRVARKQLSAGDWVWIPVTEVQSHRPGWKPDHEGAMATAQIKSKVSSSATGAGSRSWVTEVTGLSSGGLPDAIEVAGRRLRRHSKVVVIRVGDWETEQSLLNPLAASIQRQLALLLPPGQVDVEYIRTLEELAGALTYHGGGRTGTTERTPYGYLVLVGHGRPTRGTISAGIRFGNTWHTDAEIAAKITSLAPLGASFGDAIFASLCCSTGDASFARNFSDALNTTFVGPSGVLHAYEGAGFVHRLFFDHFMAGQTWAPACSATKRATAEFETQFRFWKDGSETH